MNNTKDLFYDLIKEYGKEGFINKVSEYELKRIIESFMRSLEEDKKKDVYNMIYKNKCIDLISVYVGYDTDIKEAQAISKQVLELFNDSIKERDIRDKEEQEKVGNLNNNRRLEKRRIEGLSTTLEIFSKLTNIYGKGLEEYGLREGGENESELQETIDSIRKIYEAVISLKEEVNPPANLFKAFIYLSDEECEKYMDLHGNYALNSYMKYLIKKPKFLEGGLRKGARWFSLDSLDTDSMELIMETDNEFLHKAVLYYVDKEKKHLSVTLKKELAKNKNISKVILNRLVKSRSCDVLEELVTNRKLLEDEEKCLEVFKKASNGYYSGKNSYFKKTVYSKLSIKDKALYSV